jgi:hypothetical protein
MGGRLTFLVGVLGGCCSTCPLFESSGEVEKGEVVNSIAAAWGPAASSKAGTAKTLAGAPTVRGFYGTCQSHCNDSMEVNGNYSKNDDGCDFLTLKHQPDSH